MFAVRYAYSYGHKSADAAWQKVSDLFAEGEISECEKPRVEHYATTEGARRFKITLQEG